MTSRVAAGRFFLTTSSSTRYTGTEVDRSRNSRRASSAGSSGVRGLQRPTTNSRPLARLTRMGAVTLGSPTRSSEALRLRLTSLSPCRFKSSNRRSVEDSMRSKLRWDLAGLSAAIGGGSPRRACPAIRAQACSCRSGGSGSRSYRRSLGSPPESARAASKMDTPRFADALGEARASRKSVVEVYLCFRAPPASYSHGGVGIRPGVLECPNPESCRRPW